MTDVRRITAAPTAGLTPELALAVIYARAIQRHEENKAGEPAPEPDGHDGTKAKEDSASVSNIHD